jgi:hypothetical protein
MSSKSIFPEVESIAGHRTDRGSSTIASSAAWRTPGLDPGGVDRGRPRPRFRWPHRLGRPALDEAVRRPRGFEQGGDVALADSPQRGPRPDPQAWVPIGEGLEDRGLRGRDPPSCRLGLPILLRLQLGRAIPADVCECSSGIVMQVSIVATYQPRREPEWRVRRSVPPRL